MDKAKTQQALFSLKRKPIVTSYDTALRTRNYLNRWGGRGEADVLDLSTFVNTTYLDPFFKNPGSRISDCIKLSESLYSTNRIYQNMLDYLTNMYYWRYVTTPRKVKSKKNTTTKEDYQLIYNKMLELVDGLNIEVNFPRILLNLFKDGQIYLYTVGDKGSKGVATLILPITFCRSTAMTQYGTTQIEFDFSFFDTIASSDKEREKVFTLFPPEFKEGYDLYKANKGQKWIALNPKLSTSIVLNETGFPTFLSVFYDMIDYKNYKLNELDRNTNGLERLVVQEINPETTGLELPEIQDLHASMADSINGNGTTLVTSPGTIHVEQIQDERSTENKVLENAYKSIFDNGGFNNELFTGDSQLGLQASIYRDLNYVWKYIEQIVTFYNVALNNIFNFSEYQISFRILPISQYNEKDKMDMYHQNATLGVGLVDFIVATGMKQVDIESTLEMESFLDLSNRLVPLQSSHTQSSSTSESKSNETEQKNKNNSDGTEEESSKDDESVEETDSKSDKTNEE